MKIELDPEMMQSVEEHQEFPMGEAVVRPVRGLKKRLSVWKLAVERRQKLKERTRGYCESWKKLAVDRIRMTHHAKVARHRGHNHVTR
jgi:hypothetical protein